MIGLLLVAFLAVFSVSFCWANVELELGSLSYSQPLEKAEVYEGKFPERKTERVAVFQVVSTGKIFIVYDFSHIALGADGCILVQYEEKEVVAKFLCFWGYEATEKGSTDSVNVGW